MKQTIGDVDRRTILRGVGAVALTGTLAGCGGGGDGGDSGGDGNLPSGVSGYLSGARNADGPAADETGSDSVTVMVGAGSGLAFGPAAVRISPGTTVTWEWTGDGGPHNVVAESEAFDSGSAQTSGTFEHTFESVGNYRYYCLPHRGSGMKGAIIVEADPSDETTE